MIRYIDAERLVAWCMETYKTQSTVLGKAYVNALLTEVDSCPAADVVEIPEGGIGNLSDGYHTFNELYHHRAILFSVICNSMPDKAWKSKMHDTGDMFDGMFIVGIETPEGQATYHYDIEPYWDMFKVKELEKAPKWDGHTPQVAIDRISKISADVVEVRHGHWIEHTVKPDWLEDDVEVFYNCSECGSSHWSIIPPYCPNCGAKMDGERSANGKS